MAKSSLIRTAEGRGRAAVATIAILIVAGLAVACTTAGASGGGQAADARAARTQSISDTATLHLVKASGAMLYETGPVSGEFPGNMRADLRTGASFSGSFTIYTRHGIVTGRGTATPHGSGRYESFSGSMTLTGGSGRYAHARGHAGLYGTFDHRTDAFLIQTTGDLSY